jgi:hypothetical protein
MNFINNQRVQILQQSDNSVKIIANQNTSTPGAYLKFNTNKQNYKFSFVGYKNKLSVLTKLWITDDTKKLIFISENYGLSSTMNTIVYDFINLNKLNIIFIGFLFEKCNKNDYFIIKSFNATVIPSQIIKTPLPLPKKRIMTNGNIKTLNVIKNQKVKIRLLDTELIVICDQNNSTPGIYCSFIIDKNWNYTIKINGNTMDDCDTRLWIGNSTKKRIILSDKSIFKKELTNVIYEYKNDGNLTQILVGVLFCNSKKNNQFMINNLELIKKDKTEKVKNMYKNSPIYKNFIKKHVPIQQKKILLISDTKTLLSDINNLQMQINSYNNFRIDLIINKNLSICDINYLFENKYIDNIYYDLIIISVGYNDVLNIETENKFELTLVSGENIIINRKQEINFTYDEHGDKILSNKLLSSITTRILNENENKVSNILYDNAINNIINDIPIQCISIDKIKEEINKLLLYTNIKYVSMNAINDNNDVNKYNNLIPTKYKLTSMISSSDIINYLLDLRSNFVFNIRINPNEKPSYRLDNFIILLKLCQNYADFMKNIKIIIIEQDYTQHLKINVNDYKPLNIEYHFLYNPHNFNRGFGYNCASKHYCNYNTLVFLDSDIIFDEDLFININNINNNKYLFISPYKHVYSTTNSERNYFINNNKLKNENWKQYQNLVTFSGGILLCNKKKYLDLGGYDEFNSYGYEDRSLDVKINAMIDDKKIHIDKKTLIHLYHQKTPQVTNNNVTKYYKSLYNCESITKLNKYDYIHKNCEHNDDSIIKKYIFDQRKYIGNINIFKLDQFYKVPPVNLPQCIIFKYFKDNINNDYYNYLKNKRVVIVGPAPSIVNSEQMKLINSYDVVVRINKAHPIPENMKIDIGSRTDILYNCLNTHPECGGKLDMSVLKNDIQWLCCPYPPIDPFKKDINKFNYANKQHNIKFHHIDTNLYNLLAEKTESRPNSGICAMIDLLSFDIKELYITGFTFFKGGYYSAYRSYNEKQVMDFMNNAGNHDQQKQYEVMRNVFMKDKRIKTDKALSDIIKNGL